MTAYIWDLDGTLLDSYPVITEAARRAAEQAGLSDPPEEILGKVKRETLSAYLRDASGRSGVPFEELLAEYRRLTHEMDGEIRAMDGAEETLERLEREGGTHFVYTHRGKSAGPILERLGLLGFFREIVTPEAGFPLKPAGDGVRYLVEKYGLDPEKTWYVGDRSLDVLCGRDAGVKTMLLLEPDSPVAPTGVEDRIIRSLREA